MLMAAIDGSITLIATPDIFRAPVRRLFASFRG